MCLEDILLISLLLSIILPNSNLPANKILISAFSYLSKFPKWATAYKFPPKIVTSKLIDIKTSVGRTRRINYIAQIEKVNLDKLITNIDCLLSFLRINLKEKEIKEADDIFIIKIPNVFFLLRDYSC